VNRGIEEFELAFRRDPSDADAFAALRRAYQAEERLDALADLFERRAAYLHDPQKAADLLLQAGEVHARRADLRGELRALAKAIEIAPGHRRALDRMRSFCREKEQWTELLRVLVFEAEAAAGDSKRLAAIEHEAGEIWEQQFHRLDRAIQHYQRAFKANPTQVESIEAGRRIYTAMGHYKTVASLYQVELSTCADAKRRVELLLELGKLQWEKLGELEAAGRTLSDASQSRPGDEAILEKLGDLYASPEWPSAGGLEKAASIFMQIAQRRQARGDRDGSISYLRRALGADPENDSAYQRLERAYEETGRWEDLDRLYRQKLSVTTGVEQVALLMRRAELLDKKLGDRKGARECYELVLPHEPLGGPASTRLLELLRADGDWEKVAELTRRMIEASGDRQARLRLQLELALICRDHLEDGEAAAHLFHEILQDEPGHRKALAAYEDYFRQKGDYRNLAELLRFAAQAAIDAAAPPMEICARLEELADVSERRLGDLEGAVEAWQLISEHHPDTERSREALGRLGAKMRMWHGMVNVLERELAAARNPAQHTAVLRKMAQLYYEKKADPLRTISMLRELLEQTQGDEGALRMLVDLYERESDHLGLAWALERQLGTILTKQERVAALKRLAEIYADKLDRPKEALGALNALLELNPADSKVQDRILTLLEKTEDLEQLARMLEYRSQVSRSLGDRITAFKALAKLMDERLENPGRAAAYWEEVKQLDPEDTECLEALAPIYDRLARSHELLGVLKQRLALSREASPTVRAAILRKIAVIADQRLGDAEEAVTAYEALVALLPADRDTIDALARLYARLERHQDLVRVLGRQLELADDPEQSVALAFKQADLLEEKLGDLEGAKLIFEHIISDHAPSDTDAHRRLKEIYLRRGEHRRACEIAERELFLTPEDAVDRLQLTLEVAELWRDKVKDDQRALLAYERVLELDADNPDALAALRRLYHRTGAFSKLVALGATLFASLAEDRERQVLLLELAQVYEVELREPENAFEWYRRAFDLYADDGTALAQMRRLAEAHGLWEDLLAAYGEASRRPGTPEQTLLLTQEMARICELELGDPARAFSTLASALEVDPTGDEVLTDLERLADAAGQPGEMIAIFEHAIDAAELDPELQQSLLRRKIALCEGKAALPGVALDDLIRLHGLAAEEDESVLSAIERLATSTGRWEDALEVHASRYQRAEREERLEILRHVAGLVEGQMGDLLRAFRVHLRAFALRPTDPPTIEHLWRLARVLADTVPIAPRTTATGERVAVDDADVLDAEEMEELDELDLVEEQSSQLLVIEASKPRRGEATIDDPTLLDHTPARLPPPRPRMPSRRMRVMTRTATPPPPSSPPAQPATLFGAQPLLVSPWQELTQAYLALATGDLPGRIQILLEVARIWDEGADDPEQAFEALADAAAIGIEHAEVEAQLAALAEKRDAFDRMLTVYLDEIERAADAGTLLGLHSKVAAMLLARGRRSDAEGHYSAILAVAPDNQDAAERLRARYAEDGRWEDLAFLQERQLEALSDTLGQEGRKERLRELADLYQHTLNRPFETVDFLTRLCAEDPEDLAIQLRLADLYQELSIWPRLIESLQSVLERTSDQAERVVHLLRIARTYEEELELPDRAIETFELVLGEQPTNAVALEALDRLYLDHDRPEDLIEVLKLRVELAETEPELARQLLARLAATLESCRGAEGLAEAAAALQRARGLGPLDPDLEEALARVLIQAGETAAAIDLLRERVESSRREERPATEVAAILVRLARIQLEQLHDPGSARTTLEEALQATPAGVEVLRALAELHLRNQDWGSYVETQSRLAEVAPENPDAPAILLLAGEAARDRIADRDRAAQLFERALELDPTRLPAIDALLPLCSDDLERRESLLQLKLDLIEEPPVKAATMAELGRVLHRRGAPPEAATVLYQQAIELDPGCVTALDALSLLLVELGRLEAARALLVGALHGLARTRESGPLYFRLGQVFEQLDQSDEGYSYLTEALRLEPKNLLLRIAAGMNRFRGGAWRDALRHLQEVSGHPDAAQHAAEAAEALHTAGRCESVLKRMDRAREWYQAALALQPEHIPSLRELAALAAAAGEHRRAAELLERLRALLAPGEERRAALRTLGEILGTRLEDLEGAASCYAELVQDLPEDEASRLELLPVILPVLRSVGRHAVAARAAEELADLLSGKIEIRDMLLVAATEWIAEGAVEKAEAHLRTVLNLDPGSLEAAERLVHLLELDGRHGEIDSLLAELLRDLPTLTREERPRVAALHASLGRARQAQGDRDGAIAALTSSLELVESIAVRELLAELYEGDPEHAVAALQNHRALCLADPGRIVSLRVLAGHANEAQGPYRAYCYYQVLEALGELGGAGAEFMASYQPPALDADSLYPGEIGAAERDSFLRAAEVHGLSEVFALIWEAAPALLGRDIGQHGVDPQDRVSPVSDSDLAKVYAACARALGVKQTALYVRKGGELRGAGVQVVGMAPPALIVDDRIAEGRSVSELRFLVGRALELTHSSYILAAGLERSEFSRLLSSVLRAFHPRHMRGRRDLGADALEQAQTLRKAMPFKIARRLGEIFRTETEIKFDSGLWRQAVTRSANRAGLVLCGDLSVAIRLLCEEDPSLASLQLDELVRSAPAVRDLMAFAASEGYYACRLRLGMGGSG
jgi:tetratricopeptide (TPR) repeat protein